MLGWWLLGERSHPIPTEPALFPGHGTVCYGRDLIAGFLQGWRSTSARAWQWDLHFAPPSSEGSDSKEEPAVSTWFFPSCNSLQPMQQLPFLPLTKTLQLCLLQAPSVPRSACSSYPNNLPQQLGKRVQGFSQSQGGKKSCTNVFPHCS